MHEYSKRIGEHIKSCYSDFHSMTKEDLDELALWSKVMCSLTEFDKNIRIIEAMDEEDKMEEAEMRMGRMGYRHRDSMGRFTSGRRGYMPYPYMDDDMYMGQYLDNPAEFGRMMRGGYNDGVNGNPGNTMGLNRRNGNRNGYDHPERSRHTEAYDRWKTEKRYFTETQDPAHKANMDEETKHHVDDTIASMKEMWNASDNVQMKQQIKQDLTELVRSMNV